MIISHIKHIAEESECWAIQTNEEHSLGVAEKAEEFASVLGMAAWGRVMGLLHDKGKEQKGFQNYIEAVTGYDPKKVVNKVYHAYVGALIAKDLYPQVYPLLAYPIMGHHAGLKDYTAFEERMCAELPHDVAEAPLNISLSIPAVLQGLRKEDLHHLVRLLYSCLVDADYLDTEQFMNEEAASARVLHITMAELKEKLDAYLYRFKQGGTISEINQIRNEIQNLSLTSSSDAPGFYSLTVPTGGGKTISSLVWAVNHALKYGKKRIIIAIPYTSIIVQTAQILRDIFGEENVLEHHSNVDFSSLKDKSLSLQFKLATENWDYPIIVTTNVQLFESMFSNKPSSCRKLHNICDSVLILDEVQTLPLDYLQPIIDSLLSYQKCFGVSVLFTTASLPALKGDIILSDGYRNKLCGIPAIKEIVPRSMLLHEKLRRVNLHFDERTSTYDDIAERVMKYRQVLCIVNTRKDAKEIYTRLPQEGITIHLSRMMCSKHIMEVITMIKLALKDPSGPIIRVVATQLIEAGVDIDFPVVLRQEAGLDSVLQAAGRCNREGKLGVSDAYVFRLNKKLPTGYLCKSSYAQKALPKDSDWFAPEVMTAYFMQLYSRWASVKTSFDQAQIKDHLCKPFNFNFEKASKNFRLIDEIGVSIIVNYGESVNLVAKLKRDGMNHALMQKLGQYIVNVKESAFKELKMSNLVEPIFEDSNLYFLPDREQYDASIGLVIESHWLEEILIK